MDSGDGRARAVVPYHSNGDMLSLADWRAHGPRYFETRRGNELQDNESRERSGMGRSRHEWDVVYEDGAEGQLVLFNSALRAMLAHQLPVAQGNGREGVEGRAARALPFVREDYFDILSDTVPSSEQLNASAFAAGYYATFFRELRRIGTGGFGSVYLCRHVLDGIDLGEYAVKKLPLSSTQTRSWLTKTMRELKVLQRLHHTNIVQFRHCWVEVHRAGDFGPEVPTLFMLMEFCNQGNLDARLFGEAMERTGPIPGFLPDEEILFYLLDVCEGLSHLHDEGIVHRDIKPANLLLHRSIGAKRTRMLISDFGTAARFGEVEGASGTLEYMAPELLSTVDLMKLEHVVEPSADLWSLGVVLYAMMYGRTPWVAHAAENGDEEGQTGLNSTRVRDAAFAARRSRASSAEVKYSRESDTVPVTPHHSVEDFDVLVDRILCYDYSKLYIPRRPVRPPVLMELAAQLLQRDPAARPTAREVLSTVERLVRQTSLRSSHEGAYRDGASMQASGETGVVAQLVRAVAPGGAQRPVIAVGVGSVAGVSRRRQPNLPVRSRSARSDSLVWLGGRPRLSFRRMVDFVMLLAVAVGAGWLSHPALALLLAFAVVPFVFDELFVRAGSSALMFLFLVGWSLQVLGRRGFLSREESACLVLGWICCGLTGLVLAHMLLARRRRN